MNRVDQSGAHADGDIAGRDINKHYHYPQIPSRLCSILERLEEERKSNKKFDQILDELQHFYESRDSSEVRGLEEKLEDGKRTDLIHSAAKRKEIFAKRLAEYQHYRSAQELFSYLLVAVVGRFQKTIAPLLEAEVTDTSIDAAIEESVIEPTMDELMHNPLGLSRLHVHGMVYFLTGNCFIEWTKGGSDAPVSPST